MDVVFNLKNESLQPLGSLERGAVGISRLRGFFFLSIKIMYPQATIEVIPADTFLHYISYVVVNGELLNKINC